MTTGVVCCDVPPGKMLYLQLLDEHYQASQTMRSFTGLMLSEHCDPICKARDEGARIGKG